MNMNPDQTITVLDMPLRARLGLSTLGDVEDTNLMIADGSIVTEVGNPVRCTLDAWDRPFACFNLRAPRATKYPKFIYGGLKMSQAYSAFIPKIISAPAVGSKIIIQPWVTPNQSRLLDVYRFAKAHVHWIIHIPAPLGTGIYLKAYAPEFDKTTETRGVRWKPSAATTIALDMPWSNDLSLVPITAGRSGQSGGALIVETIEDNSVAELNSPINMTVFCCVTDIEATGYIETVFTETEGVLPFLNFIGLAPPPPPEEESPVIRHEMEASPSNEVTAEGGAISTMETLDATMAIPIAPIVEQPTVKPDSPSAVSAVKKDETGHLGAKWYDYKTITLSSSDLGKWKLEEIDASKVTNLGEAFNLPFKRNIWMTGSMDAGYMHGMVVQLNIARSPQISGLVMVRDSQAMSSLYYVPFGAKVEIPLVPSRFNALESSAPHMWTTPWLHTDTEALFGLHYNLIGFNRTTDIADVKIKIAIRPGHCSFHVPIKPMPRVPVPPAMELILNKFRKIMEEPDDKIEMIRQESDELAASPLMANATNLPAFHITPFPGETVEATALHSELGDDEELDLDEFPVLVYDDDMTVDEVTAIPLPLSSVADLSSDNPTENAITQKFQRFAHIIPKCGGSLGPVVGNYTIKARVPSTVVGEFNHVCLPGDMPVEIATRIFGLGSILSIASSALSAIGGPLFSGIANTIGPLLSGVTQSVGAAAVTAGMNTVTQNAVGMITGNKKKPPKPRDSDTRAIAGDIPISRFVEMMKPVDENYESDPVFPTLLVEPKNVRGYNNEPFEKVRVQVYANMRNTKVERSLFNRTVDSGGLVKNDIYIPAAYHVELLSRFLSHKLSYMEGSMQNVWFKRYITVLDSRYRNRDMQSSIAISQIRSATVDESLTLKQLLTTHTMIFSSP